MALQDQLESDIKAALLAGEKPKAETIKGLKSALQYEAVSLRLKAADLNDDQVLKVLARESKKRQEAADMYAKAGASDRAEAELSEKAIIDLYLPAQLSEEEIAASINEEVSKLENPTPADMGKLIGAVKGKLGPQADGATIARLVKERLSGK